MIYHVTLISRYTYTLHVSLKGARYFSTNSTSPFVHLNLRGQIQGSQFVICAEGLYTLLTLDIPVYQLSGWFVIFKIYAGHIINLQVGSHTFIMNVIHYRVLNK